MSIVFDRCFIQVREGEPIEVTGTSVILRQYAIVPIESLETVEDVSIFLRRLGLFKRGLR